MGKKIAPVNLNVAFPEIAKTWHSTKNLNLLPVDVSTGSDIYAWWVCDKGHEYRLRIKDRVKSKQCPVCSNRRLVPGVNDLQTRFPKLADQWSRSKNSEPDPRNVSSGSGEGVWWECELGHEWKVGVNSRVFFDSG